MKTTKSTYLAAIPAGSREVTVVFNFVSERTVERSQTSSVRIDPRQYGHWNQPQAYSYLLHCHFLLISTCAIKI
jgi:hypothetical protein